MKWLSPPGHAVAVTLLFGLLYTLFFAPVIFADRLLAPGDARDLGLPHYQAAHTLWTPDLFAGFPTVADPQSQLWYPPALVLSWLPHSWNAFVVSAYVLASCFAYGYVYLLTGSRCAAFVTGTVYGLSGFFMAHLGHTNVIHSAAWMPLLPWALEQLRRRVTPGWVVVGAVAVACTTLAGHPQFLVYTLLLGGLYVLCLGRGAPAGALAYGLASLGTVALGLGLAALLLLPMRELQGQSLRAQLSFQDFVGYSLPLQELPRLLLPHCCGGNWNPVTGTAAPAFAGGGGLAEATGYVGLLPLLLAGLGFGFARCRPVARFWLAAAVLSVLLALGNKTPLPYGLRYVPIYNQFRIPARHFVHGTLGIGVLAGLAVAEFPTLALATRVRALRRGTLVLGAAVALALAVFAVFYTNGAYTRGLPAELTARLRILTWDNPALVLPLLVLSLGLAAAWYWCRRPGPAAQVALCLVVVLDLASFGWCCEWHHEAPTEELFREPEGLRACAATLAATGQRLVPLDFHVAAESVPPNRNRLWHLPSLAGYCPLALARYSRMTGIDYHGFTRYDALAADDCSFDLLAARYVLVPRSWLGMATPHPDVARNLADGGRWRHVQDLEEMAVFENRRALPRAWLVPRLVRLDADATVETVRTSRLPNGEPYDPRTVALVEEALPLANEWADPDAEARLVPISDTHLEVHTRSKAPAFLVLSDTSYQGWEAEVNGTPAPIYRTNGVLRGVALPAGENVVRFVFRPHSFLVGVAVTAVAVVVALALLGWQAVLALRVRARLRASVHARVATADPHPELPPCPAPPLRQAEAARCWPG